MAAVLTPTHAPWHDLEPVEVPSRAARPRLTVLDGGRAGVRAHRRQRGVGPVRVVIAGVVTALVVALALVGVAALLGAGAAASGPAPTANGEVTGAAVAPSAPVTGAGEVVVRPGDTLWSIASGLRPDGDVRPLVDELAERAGGATLVPGQRIDVTGLG
jgi:hypothetical protein